MIKTRTKYKPLTESLAVYALFTSWYTALHDDTNDTQLKIQLILTKLDPPEGQAISLRQIVSTTLAGLFLISEPQAQDLVSAATATVAQTFVKAIKQTSDVVTLLWPDTKLDASRYLQIVDLGNDPQTIDEALTSVIDGGLKPLMSSISFFIAFAQPGVFSGTPTIAFPAGKSGLTYANTTYILTRAMTAQIWEVNARTTSKQQAEKDLACTFDSRNLCAKDGSFYSDATKRLYRVSRKGSSGEEASQLMNDIVDMQWSDLALVFDKAYECSAAGRIGQDPLANFGVGGDFKTACVSQLNVKVS
ncbi:MAG: hypothetical protein Q9168_006680 [Polycauliona sp. 1 TL-2023]